MSLTVDIQEEGGMLVAHCNEHDIVSWAPNMFALRLKFRDMVAAWMLTVGLKSATVKTDTLGTFVIRNVRERKKIVHLRGRPHDEGA